jgi:PTH1 family peptidyl-tRNA hydrolase
VGFAVVMRLAERHQVSVRHQLVSPPSGRPAGVFGDYEEGAQRVRLLMPLTMMNESGEALKGLGVEPADLLRVCDDVNLPLGTLRVRAQGSAGGHHGLQSCVEILGTDEVPRLRIGVGTSDLPKELYHFVLSPFAQSERPVIARAITQAAEACEMWVKDGITAAMDRYNAVTQDA